MTDKHVKNMFAKMIEPNKQIEHVMLDSATELPVDSATLSYVSPDGTNSKIIVDPNPPSLYIGQDWIPCTERLPDMHPADTFVARQGIEQISDLCIVTIYDGRNYLVDTSCRLRDGEWWSEKIRTLISINRRHDVIAWMPIPQPYIPQEIK